MPTKCSEYASKMEAFLTTHELLSLGEANKKSSLLQRIKLNRNGKWNIQKVMEIHQAPQLKSLNLV